MQRSVAAVAVLANLVSHSLAQSNPWDKYQHAPGPDRTFYPVNWSKTCGAGECTFT